MSDHGAGAASPAAIYLSLGFHDHQPVGNFPEVFESHYLSAYLPFLDGMEAHPAIPFSLHVTGPLLLWLGREHPEYVARLRRLCASGRLEMKGGGFYEPILACIPDADKHEQLTRLSCHLRDTLDVTPEGAWIAERVWEPHLAAHLACAGLRYATLDDSHFQAVGLDTDAALGYFVTEDGGHRFDLFPISKPLRYLIPFGEPEAVVDHLRGLATEWTRRRAAGLLPPDAPPPLAVYDDDGEKFGGWPGTNAHVYGSGWMERFLTVLEREAEAGWLALTTLGEFRRRFPPLGRIYLPTASYAEMQEWSEGFFRNFLVRYDEANLLHKRMLYTSGRVRRRLAELGLAQDGTARPPDGFADPNDAETAVGAHTTAPLERRGDRRDVLEAYDHLLRAQCNDAYWHGVFGGLYLPHLRHAVNGALISAERLLPAEMRPAIEVLDLDLDGHDEVLLRSEEAAVLLAPARGGTVVCLDHLPSAFALLDTLRRRREPEHAALEELAATARAAEETAAREGAEASAHDLAPRPDSPENPAPPPTLTIHETVRMKEPGLEKMLFVDHHPRSAFLDHFYHLETTLRDLVEGTAIELGDLVNAPYECTVEPGAAGPPGSAEPPVVTLRRLGMVAGVRVQVEKQVALARGGASLIVDYRVHVPVDVPAAPGSAPPSAEGADPSAEAMAPIGGAGRTALFAPEVNLTLLAGRAHDRYVLVDGQRPSESFLADEGAHHGAQSVELVDESVGIRARLAWELTGSVRREPPATLWRHGVLTVSLSEDGFERIYQSTALVPAWPLPLEPGAELRVRLRLDVMSDGPAR